MNCECGHHKVSHAVEDLGNPMTGPCDYCGCLKFRDPINERLKSIAALCTTPYWTNDRKQKIVAKVNEIQVLRSHASECI